jgi:hypothetical protein
MKQSEHRITLELGGHFDSAQPSKPFIIVMEGYTNEHAVSIVLGAVGDWFQETRTVVSGVFSSLPEIEVAVPTPTWLRSMHHEFGPVTGYKFFGKFVSADMPEEAARQLALELTLIVARRIDRSVDLIFNANRIQVAPD